MLAAPALHFALLGALVFAVAEVWSPSLQDVSAGVSRDIVIDAARIRGVRRDYSLANQVDADQETTRALVATLVDEEILFREALARGFEQADRSIAWRLVEKMRYLGEDRGEDVGALYHKALDLGLHRSDLIVRRILIEKMRLLAARSVPKPTDAELAAWYAQHKSEYAQAGRVTLRHVYFDRSRRGAEATREAATAAWAGVQLHDGKAPPAKGDPFVMGSRLAAQSRADLTKSFGPVFAEEAVSLPEGEWSGPVESTYGWHLVFVEKRLVARVPELSEVRSRVERSWENQRRIERADELLAELRPSYTVRIDEDAIMAQEAN